MCKKDFVIFIEGNAYNILSEQIVIEWAKTDIHISRMEELSMLKELIDRILEDIGLESISGYEPEDNGGWGGRNEELTDIS